MTFGRWQHPGINRRAAVQAGAIGLLGLGTNHLEALRAASPESQATPATAKSCIYIFLSGGLAQQDSFDLKPDAPDTIRGEFNPIDTATPGIQICEHLPMLAARSQHWALVRSLTHPTNGHTLGHYFMLTGRSIKSAAFKGDRKPRPGDWPSISSTVGELTCNECLGSEIHLQQSFEPPMRKPMLSPIEPRGQTCHSIGAALLLGTNGRRK